MSTVKPTRRLLVVTQNDKVYDYIIQLLSANEFSPILRANSAGEAKRMLVSSAVDIVIINTPLPDDFGVELAIDISDAPMGILLLVKNELFEQVSYRVEDSGVLTLGKPSSRQAVFAAIKLLAAMSTKLEKMEKKNHTLMEKMADIRTVNRAKWLLIENVNMTEKDAHYYIEKQAMDMRLSRKEVAQNIIRTYDN